jgi:predicted nucleic acid-binding protein
VTPPLIVVADTSPINYLIQIGCDGLLAKLYGRITIPFGVMQELHHTSAPPAVRQWLTHVPAWIDVRPITSSPDTSLAYLGLGEREALQLAEEQHADLLLIDERKGRLEARRRGLKTTGTLGVLLSAGAVGLIDPEAAYLRLLTETSFRTSAALETQFREQIRKP